VLGPEMKSTGEVMGISEDFGIAFAKALAAAGGSIPSSGTVFISVNDYDKGVVVPHARAMAGMGFRIVATRGTAEVLARAGVPVEPVYKVNEGRPNVVDRIKSGEIDLVFNTPLGRESFLHDGVIRKTATLHGVLCVTTLTGAAATVQAIRALRARDFTADLLSLQELHAAPTAGAAADAAGGALEGVGAAGSPPPVPPA